MRLRLLISIPIGIVLMLTACDLKSKQSEQAAKPRLEELVKSNVDINEQSWIGE